MVEEEEEAGRDESCLKEPGNREQAGGEGAPPSQAQDLLSIFGVQPRPGTDASAGEKLVSWAPKGSCLKINSIHV